MRLTLAHVGANLNSKDAYEQLSSMYVGRCSQFAESAAEAFRTEPALLAWIDRQRQRMPATLVLLDSRGRQMSSENFARWLGQQRDAGARHTVFAIGPDNGWSPSAAQRAQLIWSLGAITLPHALARLVAAEQIYRAFTILAGHPYHLGH